MHATTILMVRKGGRVVIGGDGQVSLGQTIVKGNARKVRRLAKGSVIGGFAGATADAFTLFERLEAKLEQYPGQLTRACVELTKDWAHRPLSAAAGSDDAGGRQGRQPAALRIRRRARARERCHGDRLRRQLCPRRRPRPEEGDLDAEAIVRRSMRIAAEICVYTNGNLVIEALDVG